MKYCKDGDAGVNISTSIVSNGSKITKKWFDKYGQYLDVLAISCDSFNPETLDRIGRGIAVARKNNDVSADAYFGNDLSRGLAIV